MSGKKLQVTEGNAKSVGAVALCRRIQEEEVVLILSCDKLTVRIECYSSGEMKKK